MTGDPTQIAEPLAGSGLYHLMFLRVSPEDFIIYANSALADYIGVAKDIILGAPFEEFQKRLRGEMLDCFQRPERGRGSNRLVTDDAGRVFEARTYSENGVLDVVLSEVTHAAAAFGDLLRSTGTPIEKLTEEEIRILRQADRRFATVSVAQMRGLGGVANRLPPHEMQLMLDAFAEEMSECILITGSTVAQIAGDSVTGIFGSPRYHRDHALRAVTSACLQLDRLTKLHDAFSKQGRELPPCSIAIATGELLLAVVETAAHRSCHALGETVEHAAALARVCRPGEVVLTEATLKEIISNLPDGWEYLRADTETEADLSDFKWDGATVEPLPPSLRKIAYLVGPGVKSDASRTELYFDYLYAIPDHYSGHVISILRVVRPQLAGSSIELDESNVVTTTTAMFLGKYRLLSVVGEGGMGKVWRAQDRFANTVAIKVLNTSEAANSSQLQRFKREADIMARLPHRNICRVYEFNEFESVNYIAMEFVDGLTLADLLYSGEYAKPGFPASKDAATSLPDLIHSIRSLRDMPHYGEAEGGNPDEKLAPKTSRILPVEQALSIVRKICDAVQFAHEHGVLHRDLKPGNILLREDGEPLVADFGLAKMDGAGGGSASLSVSGHVVGTVENMAPEQALSSKTVDGCADVFSIGTILYQLLTGYKFFTATGNLLADAQALQTYTPHRPRVLNRKIDSDLEIITMKALRPDRADRYRTVSALKADLERFQRGEVISAKPINPGDLLKKLILRHKAISALTAIFILILTVGMGIAAWTINQGRLAALAAQRAAETERLEAETQRAEADRARQLAESQKNAAERALAALKLAQQAELEAVDLHQKAVAEAHQYSQQKEQAEAERQKLAALADKQASELKETQARFDELKSRTDEQRTRTDDQSLDAAQRSMDAALTNYQFGFSPKGLEELASTTAMLKQANEVMLHLTDVLTTAPDFVPALLLKARLHLGLMEIAHARSTLRHAAEAARAQPDPAGSEGLASLTRIVDALGAANSPSAEAVSAALRKTDDALDRAAANLLDALRTRSAGRRTSSVPGSVFGRESIPGELAFNLRLANPRATAVKAIRDSTGHLAIEVVTKDAPIDLSPLRTLEVQTLRITGASDLDWRTLHSLPIVFLDLGNCSISGLGSSPQNRGLLRVRKLRVAGTRIADLREIAQLPLIEDLDISGTPIRNLLPLSGRKLQQLNLADCQAGPISALDWMPLQTLILSPPLCADLKASLRLRASRTLRSIRAPGDPEQQSAAEFWHRLDAGDYDPPPAP